MNFSLAPSRARQQQKMTSRLPALRRNEAGTRSNQARLQQMQSRAAVAAAPAAVNQALKTPGKPMDAGLRGFFEPKFGADLSAIRIHEGATAAQSAEAVGARAYTVGKDIVFGTGQLRPGDPAGMRLMAHEVAHSLQHGDRTNVVSRACLSPAICNPPEAKKGSQDTFVKDTESKPENKAKAQSRETACSKTPPDPACTADGHGRIATELTKYMAAQLPARASAIHRLIVDMDMPADYGAYTNDCDSFKPNIPGGAGKQCTFVPNALELQAGQYNAGENQIGGKSRLGWAQIAQRVLTHETEHALFEAAKTTGTEVNDPKIACDFAANESSLTEIAAIISEFKPVHAKALGRTGATRDANLDGWFEFWIKSGKENIVGNLQAIRCNCDCGPADALIIKMFDFATKDWNTYEKWLYNTTLRDPKWGLNWPVAPPASVPVDELPSSGPTINPNDLPTVTSPAAAPATPPVKKP